MKLGVLVYLENNEKQVLMIHRNKKDEHQGLWLAPGGKVEPNEAPYETAIREMLEETVCKLRTMNFGLFSLSLMMETHHLVMNGMFLYFTQTVFPELFRKLPRG
ncbi:MAG: hypothetical protein CM1200mP30_15410 [Pseudomonadota bacterium]|nr:MAG: hypothetical protein CM1200mP30_15410 [Pseudomonadota bacterium]